MSGGRPRAQGRRLPPTALQAAQQAQQQVFGQRSTRRAPNLMPAGLSAHAVPLARPAAPPAPINLTPLQYFNSWPQARQMKVFYSTWLVTLNTNKRNMPQITRAQIISTLQSIFNANPPANVIQWRKQAPGTAASRDLEFAPDSNMHNKILAHSELLGNLETGVIQGRVHWHALISIKHYGHIYLNQAELRRIFPVFLYINIRFIPSVMDPVLTYIYKNNGRGTAGQVRAAQQQLNTVSHQAANYGLQQFLPVRRARSVPPRGRSG
jgi:hypothetical protein